MFQSAHHTHSLQHFAKDHVFAVQVRSSHCRNEELGAICVLPSIRHTQQSRSLMLESKNSEFINCYIWFGTVLFILKEDHIVPPTTIYNSQGNSYL